MLHPMLCCPIYINDTSELRAKVNFKVTKRSYNYELSRSKSSQHRFWMFDKWKESDTSCIHLEFGFRNSLYSALGTSFVNLHKSYIHLKTMSNYILVYYPYSEPIVSEVLPTPLGHRLYSYLSTYYRWTHTYLST